MENARTICICLQSAIWLRVVYETTSCSQTQLQPPGWEEKDAKVTQNEEDWECSLSASRAEQRYQKTAESANLSSLIQRYFK